MNKQIKIIEQASGRNLYVFEAVSDNNIIGTLNFEKTKAIKTGLRGVSSVVNALIPEFQLSEEATKISGINGSAVKLLMDYSTKSFANKYTSRTLIFYDVNFIPKGAETYLKTLGFKFGEDRNSKFWYKKIGNTSFIFNP